MGVGRGGARAPWVLKISAKKGCFLSFEWEKTNFTTFAPPLEKFWKIPRCAPGKNLSDAHVHIHTVLFLSALTGLCKRFGSFQTQHRRAHDHQLTFRITVTTAATERHIRLIVETIITSHTGIAHRVEHDTQGTPPHHGFNLLISVECARVKHYPDLSPGFCSRGAKNHKWGTFFNMKWGDWF